MINRDVFNSFLIEESDINGTRQAPVPAAPQPAQRPPASPAVSTSLKPKAEAPADFDYSGKAWSAPLERPAEFGQGPAQVNLEITELARQGKWPAARGLAAIAKPTREEFFAECARYELRPLWIGRAAFLIAADEPDRVKVLQELHAGLVQMELITVATRLDQFICLYWIAQILGWDEAQEMRVSWIKELRRLFIRDGDTGEWRFRKDFAQPTKRLWARMVRDRLSAETVAAEVAKIRPKKRSLRKSKPSYIRAIERLPAEGTDYDWIIRVCQERLAARNTAGEMYDRRRAA